MRRVLAAALDHPGLGLAALLALWLLSSAPAMANDRMPDLGGHWSGQGLSIFIDPTRHQANTDPTKPFNRQSFIIRNVTGSMVVFAIGPELFVANLTDPNTMVVTRGGLLESYTLSRRKR